MALITCAECGQQVSDRASFCPGCGNPDIRSETTDQAAGVVPPPTTEPLPAPTQPSLPPVKATSAGGFAELRFKQTKNQRNKARSVWPTIILMAAVVGGGYLLYRNYPAILTQISGQPSRQQIENVLKDALTGSLTVKGYNIPAKYVEVTQANVHTIEPFDKDGEITLYRATGVATMRLTASGKTIGDEVSQQVGTNARRLNYQAAVAAVYSRFQAHSAIDDVPAGTQYPLGFQVIVRVVDGNVILVDGRVSSED